MPGKKKNLSTTVSSIPTVSDVKIGIITSEWNEDITFSMRDACTEELLKYGLAPEDITHLLVPGAFELPSAAKMLLSNQKIDAVICIGCVIKGETKHDEYISNAVAAGVMQLSIASGRPVIFGVLTPNDHQQALDRAGGKYGNKGVEAAHTALKMLQLAKEVQQGGKSKIGF
ncbi:MAG: 6,7-dimethyl-8-ribityllumazine synthase [Chitinophagales bacterium]|nr:6,7-dimethyl-8-ribityllumazine synthase [Chitinophagales bacterium]